MMVVLVVVVVVVEVVVEEDVMVVVEEVVEFYRMKIGEEVEGVVEVDVVVRQSLQLYLGVKRVLRINCMVTENMMEEAGEVEVGMEVEQFY